MLTDYAMAQAVSHRTYMAEAGIRFRAIACEIYGGQSGIAIGFSFNTSVLPCQWHVNNAPCLSSSTCGSYQGKGRNLGIYLGNTRNQGAMGRITFA
jgi:hypothetical protein